MAGNAGSAFVAVSTLHLGFLAYVEQVLVPTLTPGDVVVLDAVTPSDARSFFTDCGCEPE